MNSLARTQTSIPQGLPADAVSQPAVSREKNSGVQGAPNFRDLLNRAALTTPVATPAASATMGLKFSSHALARLKERSIPLDGAKLAQLENAVQSAAQKGAKESLILTDDAAYIVSVKNKTVITVLDRSSMGGNVFTNIDSTVVV